MIFWNYWQSVQEETYCSLPDCVSISQILSICKSIDDQIAENLFAHPNHGTTLPAQICQVKYYERWLLNYVPTYEDIQSIKYITTYNTALLKCANIHHVNDELYYNIIQSCDRSLSNLYGRLLADKIIDSVHINEIDMVLFPTSISLDHFIK